MQLCYDRWQRNPKVCTKFLKLQTIPCAQYIVEAHCFIKLDIRYSLHELEIQYSFSLESTSGCLVSREIDWQIHTGTAFS